MVSIRDYKYKIIDENVLIGIELESKGENYYNNSIDVKFLKDDNVLRKETIDIPFLGGDNIFYVGNTYNINSFTDIKLELSLGDETIEESFYPDVNISIDKEKSSQRHLEYKVENNSSMPFNESKLNLVFYNRGELVCGTSVTLENVMNGRAYYFVYDIPESLEYTDVNTELFVPNTGVLLFRGFYFKYINYLREIDKLSKIIPSKPLEKYEDQTEKLNDIIKSAQVELKKARKFKTVKYLPIYFLLKSLLYAPIGAAVGFVGVILYVIYYFIASIFKVNVDTSDATVIKIWVIVGVIAYIVCWIIDFKLELLEITPIKEKKKTIDLANKTINDAEEMLRKNAENKDDVLKQIEEKNVLIKEENEEILNQNAERSLELTKMEKDFDEFKNKYPKYKVIEDYDDVDKSLVDVAIEDGAITFDSVELYRRTAREKIDADEKFKQQMAMRQKEVQAVQAQTQAIKASTLQSSIDASLMRQEVQRQSQAQTQAIYEQMAQADKLYKQREYYGRQVNARLDELRYENYLNSRYN